MDKCEAKPGLSQNCLDPLSPHTLRQMPEWSPYSRGQSQARGAETLVQSENLNLEGSDS